VGESGPARRAEHPSRLLSFALALSLLALFFFSLFTAGGASSLGIQLTPTALWYLPLVEAHRTCPSASTNEYESGTAYQYDVDDPVRPAYDHADKNIELRGYAANTEPDLRRDLVNYGCDDDKAPQFATAFSPPRVPALVGFHRVHHWEWRDSPDPGARAGPILWPPVTALGLQTAPGETLCVPESGYTIGGGMEVLVLFADADTVALRYTRHDSSAPPGYTLHIDNICTDPNLLALYEELDDADGPRYDYPNHSYALPNLRAGQPLGVARGDETVFAVADTGTFQDPRSLNEFWRVRPGYPAR